MLTVSDIISRVRELSHDSLQTGYDDQTILNCINGGIRFIRRVIKDYQPTILAEPPVTGTLAAAANTVTISFPITKMIDIRVAGERIGITDVASISDLAAVGVPYTYYTTGFSTIHFYPTPTSPVSYSIVAVGDFTEVSLTGASPFPNDFDDFLIEYAIIRLAAGNEFDMSQEVALMSNIMQQIQSNLAGSGQPVNQVSGYFNPLPDDYNSILGA